LLGQRGANSKTDLLMVGFLFGEEVESDKDDDYNPL